jgi:hypothetical protein
MFATVASAQESQMPEDIAWKLQEIGQVVDLPNTAASYAPLQQKEPYRGIWNMPAARFRQRGRELRKLSLHSPPL